MFLWLGFGAAVTVLALCIDTIDFPSIPDEQFARVVRWVRRWRMTVTPYNEEQVYAFINDERAAYSAAHHPLDAFYPVWVARMQFDAVSMGYAPSRAKHLNECRVALGLPPVPVPTRIDPIYGVWPPPTGTPCVRPPDVATTEPTECLRQLRWALWVADSSDSESGWMGYIFDTAREGHAKGWTSDPYWADKIAVGDGAGKGYVWPPK